MAGLTDRLRAAAYRFRLRQQIADAPTIRIHHIVNPWHAVSISPSLIGYCPHVEKLLEKRLLSSEAPTLPLAECTMKKQCGCRFRHHTDRRVDPRRANDAGFPDPRYYGPERRTKNRGRRATDI